MDEFLEIASVRNRQAAVPGADAVAAARAERLLDPLDVRGWLARVLAERMPDGDLHGSASQQRVEHLPLGSRVFDEEDLDPESPFADTPELQRLDGLGRVVRLERLLRTDDGVEPAVQDPWVVRMRHTPLLVVSNTLDEPLDWPNATVLRGDGVDIVRRLKAESDVPLRSHGSLSLNRALMAAGLVDRVQVTIFPVITGQTGEAPIFEGAEDFDLDLIESRTLDGRTQELVYRPRVHRHVAA